MPSSRPSLERVTFLGCCPACGEGRIFESLLGMAERCPVCALHIAAREQGDGPAFFGIVIVGALATVGAAVLEILYSPPYWLQAVIWPLFIIIGSLLVLRFAKACLLGIQYGANPADFQ